jgi:hypothetical protein
VQAEDDKFVKLMEAFAKVTGVKVTISRESYEDVQPKASVAANNGAGPGGRRQRRRSASSCLVDMFASYCIGREDAKSLNASSSGLALPQHPYTRRSNDLPGGATGGAAGGGAGGRGSQQRVT